MIYLYGVNCSRLFKILDNQFINLQINQLSSFEKEKVTRYKKNEDKLRTLIGIKLCKKILSQHLQVNENSIEINIDKFDRPYCNNRQWKGDFNISHSEEWVILALSLDGKVGVDIEYVKPIQMDVSKHFLTLNEVSDLMNSRNKLIRFYEYWTLKESYVKMLGTGLSYPISKIEFSLSNYEAEGQIGFKDYSSNKNGKIFFCLNKSIKDYVVALSSTKSYFPEEITYFDESIFQ